MHGMGCSRESPEGENRRLPCREAWLSSSFGVLVGSWDICDRDWDLATGPGLVFPLSQFGQTLVRADERGTLRHDCPVPVIPASLPPQNMAVCAPP